MTDTACSLVFVNHIQQIALKVKLICLVLDVGVVLFFFLAV